MPFLGPHPAVPDRDALGSPILSRFRLLLATQLSTRKDNRDRSGRRQPRFSTRSFSGTPVPDLSAVTNNGKNTDGRIERYDVAANAVIKAEALILKKFDGRALQFPTAIFARPRPRTQPFPERRASLPPCPPVPLRKSSIEYRMLVVLARARAEGSYGKSSANSTTYNARATHT